MPLLVELKTPGKNQSLHVEEVLASPGEFQLVVTDENQSHGVWQTASVTVASTTIVVTTPIDGSIRLTDLLLQAKKTANGTITVQYDDGTNTETIVSSETVNAAVSINHAFAGNIQGWVNANIELVTSHDIPATLTVGYIRIPEGKAYAQWQIER